MPPFSPINLCWRQDHVTITAVSQHSPSGLRYHNIHHQDCGITTFTIRTAVSQHSPSGLRYHNIHHQDCGITTFTIWTMVSQHSPSGPRYHRIHHQPGPLHHSIHHQDHHSTATFIPPCDRTTGACLLFLLLALSPSGPRHHNIHPSI